jgi:hypothetical protein
MSTAGSTLLVFDGVRMGAIITLNGVVLGNATDQFMRYSYEVAVTSSNNNGGAATPTAGTAQTPAAWLHPVGSTAANTLTVTFGAVLGIDTGGRFTHSAEIDWAPKMPTRECFGPGNKACLSTFGFGIWKSVYLLPVPSTAGAAVITQLVPHTFYAGGHPTSILSDDNHAGFDMRVRVELMAGGAGSGTVSVVGSWPGAAAVSTRVSVVKGSVNVTLDIPAEQTAGVHLWHPHGHGGQPLYNVTATYEQIPPSPLHPLPHFPFPLIPSSLTQ